MSNSKPLPLFTFDVLYYLNRDQLERFSIVCRALKNFIQRYFHSKPYRIFDYLRIRGVAYALRHNFAYWHPNRDDYSVQQFLAGQKCNINIQAYYYLPFAEMLPYLGPTVRIKKIDIYVAGDSTYNSRQIAEMESIAYLWRDAQIFIRSDEGYGFPIVTEDLQPILDSPTILQCRELCMFNTHFSFRDYKILYAVKIIEIRFYARNEIDLWQRFLEQTGIKPIVVFRFKSGTSLESVDNLLERFSKAFSSAVFPNPFKIVFIDYLKSLTEFREMNKTSNEILELRKGLPVELQHKNSMNDDNYTLERYSI
ncbi:hypothetical protein DdX_17086 [Ditylenchus destructor]|uniref:F-box domain-containing protein n=1 Tax=Ditylenchus destructor TaxID=166010 RepID=A0AAD4MMW6_9BILA|nr:hypothetical protein DdX_17086 [Ditylenchus destructor]